jgi:threonine aldolase
VFYIGGTKVGALCGEAVVFPRNNAPRHFFNIIKQHGALLAKSRLAGVQFDSLFTNDLYFRIARHAIDMAIQMRQLFTDTSIPIKDSPTNQQFVVLSTKQIQNLRKTIAFETWEPIDADHTLCRFVTSLATTQTDIAELAKALKTLTE